MTDRVFKVLFLCTGNSARSIMAEAILNSTGKGRFQGYSAGSHPVGKVNAFALAQISKAGFPAHSYRSKSWDEFCTPQAPRMDFVITVCSQAAAEVCPVWPGQPITARWDLEDPARMEGAKGQKDRIFALVYSQIYSRIRIFTNLPIEKLERIALQTRVDEIGQVLGKI